MIEHSHWRVLYSSFNGAIARQFRGKSPGECSKALLFAIRYRLCPLLPHLSSHIALTHTLSHPCSAELIKRHPSVGYKYLRTYIASDLSTKERLQILQNHHQFLQTVVPSDFFAKIFDSTIALWEYRTEEHVFGISMSYPHSSRNPSEQLDQEGDISLIFEADSSPVYKLNFSVVPGHLFGVQSKQAMFIGCLQGAYGKLDFIKIAATACEKAHPAVLLSFAAAAIAESLGINAIIGVSEERQLCASDNEFIFDYDKFWEELGGKKTSKNVFHLPVPIPFKPIDSIRRPYRAKAIRKRNFIQGMIDRVGSHFCRYLPPPPAKLN